MEENAEQISAKRGYAHMRRLRGYAVMLDRALLDDQRTPA